MTRIYTSFLIMFNLFEFSIIIGGIEDDSEDIKINDTNFHNIEIDDIHSDLDSGLYKTLEVLGKGSERAWNFQFPV